MWRLAAQNHRDSTNSSLPTFTQIYFTVVIRPTHLEVLLCWCFPVSVATNSSLARHMSPATGHMGVLSFLPLYSLVWSKWCHSISLLPPLKPAGEKRSQKKNHCQAGWQRWNYKLSSQLAENKTVTIASAKELMFYFVLFCRKDYEKRAEFLSISRLEPTLSEELPNLVNWTILKSMWIQHCLRCKTALVCCSKLNDIVFWLDKISNLNTSEAFF